MYMPYCTLSYFICNELAVNCFRELTWYVPFCEKFLFISLLSSRRTSMRKQSPAGSWVRRFCLMAFTWYQSIGYFSVLWYIEKSQTPKACSIGSLPQCKFVIWRSSSIWLQLFKYNSPFVDVGNNNLWPHEKETSTLRGERVAWTIIDHEINLHFFFAES